MEESVVEAIDAVVQELGRIDYAVNAAGIMGEFGPLDRLDACELDNLYYTNVRGTMFCCREEARRVAAQTPLPTHDGREGARGSIVNVSSMLACVGHENLSAYAATKQAIVGLTRGEAIDHAEHAIRVNRVCPGPVDTPMAAYLKIIYSLKKPSKGKRFRLAGFEPYMDSFQIASTAHFNFRKQKDVVDIEIRSEGSDESQCFHLTFQRKGFSWIPKYTLHLFPDGETTLALDAEIELPRWSAPQLVRLYTSLVHFGEFQGHQLPLPQCKPEGSSSAREQPLQHFWRPSQSAQDLATPETVEIFQLRSPASAMPALLSAMQLNQSGPWSLLKGWMEVSTIGGGKRVTVPGGFNNILCFVSDYCGSKAPAPGLLTNLNALRRSNEDRKDTTLSTHDDCFAADALLDLKRGR